MAVTSASHAAGFVDRAAHQPPVALGQLVPVDAHVIPARDRDADLALGAEAPGGKDDHRWPDPQLRVVPVFQGVLKLQIDGLLEAQILAELDRGDIDPLLDLDGDVQAVPRRRRR